MAVHCKAGKGRTGLALVCYMLYCGLHNKASTSRKMYDTQRCHDKKGLTILSQIRYAHYFEKYLARVKSAIICPVNESESPAIAILAVALHGIPCHSAEGFEGFFQIAVRSEDDHEEYVIYKSRSSCLSTKDAVWYLELNKDVLGNSNQGISGVRVAGDIKVQVCRQMSGIAGSKETPLCHTWMHSQFMEDPPDIMKDQQWREKGPPTASEWRERHPPPISRQLSDDEILHLNQDADLSLPSDSFSLLISKHEIDGAARDKSNLKFPSNFKLEVFWKYLPGQKGTGHTLAAAVAVENGENHSIDSPGHKKASGIALSSHSKSFKIKKKKDKPRMAALANDRAEYLQYTFRCLEIGSEPLSFVEFILSLSHKEQEDKKVAQSRKSVKETDTTSALAILQFPETQDNLRSYRQLPMPRQSPQSFVSASLGSALPFAHQEPYCPTASGYSRGSLGAAASLSPVASSEAHVQDVFGAESVPSEVADSLEISRKSADFEVKTSTPVAAAGQAFQTDSEAEDRKAERTGTANGERAQRRLEVQQNRIELQKALLEEQGDKAQTVASVPLLASRLTGLDRPGALVFTPAPFAMAATLKGFNIDGKPDGEQEAPFVDQAKGERIFLTEDSCLEILQDSRRLPDNPHPDATIQAAKKKGEGALTAWGGGGHLTSRGVQGGRPVIPRSDEEAAAAQKKATSTQATKAAAYDDVWDNEAKKPTMQTPQTTFRQTTARAAVASGETRGSTPHATPVLKSTSDVCIITPRFASKESARKEAEGEIDAGREQKDEEAAALEASKISPRSSFQKAVEEERARRRLKLLADIEGQRQQQLRQLRLQQLQQHVTQAQKQQQ